MPDKPPFDRFIQIPGPNPIVGRGDAGTFRQTFDLATGARFIKVMVENLDTNHPLTDLALTATLSG